MDGLDLAAIPVGDHAELVGRLRDLHDADATAILADTDALAEKVAAFLFDLAGRTSNSDGSDLACVMMLGALRARLRFFGVSEEGAAIACRLAIDAFNRTIAMLQAGATPGTRH